MNDEQYKWHKQGCFKSVRYGDARKRLQFKTSSVENSGFAKNKKQMKISHKWLWTNTELKQALSDIGFNNIVECEFQKGNFPDIERIEHRKGLILQAQK
jgi:hypothetical protein